MLVVASSSLPQAGGGESSQVNSVDTVKSLLGKMHALRMDVDHLRRTVTDKIAEDMGRRLTCNPQ